MNLTSARQLIACMGLIGGFAVQVCAQAPAPLPKPNLDLRVNGTVDTMVRQPDGGIVLGGNFRAVGGVARANLARLLPNGTLDPNWNPAVDNEVTILAVDSNGDIFVGGYFQHVGGAVRNRLAKVSGSGTGAVDPSWNPSPQGFVNAIALDGMGSIYVGGTFSAVGPSGASTPRNNLARFSATGTGDLDPAWDPSPDNSVGSIVFDGASVYVGGGFTSIGGQPFKYVARVASTGIGVADPGWQPALTGCCSSSLIATIVLDGSGAMYLGGDFQTVNGVARNGFAKLSLTDIGTLLPAWNPPMATSSGVQSILLDGGFVYLGEFGSSTNGVANSSLVRTTPAGTLDTGWNPSPKGSTRALAAAGNGELYAGGTFDSIGGQEHFSLGRVDAAGTALSSPDVDGTPAVTAMVSQHDGGTIIAGSFLKAQNLQRHGIFRLQPDGSIDAGWSAAIGDGVITHLAIDSSNDVFAIGPFDVVDGLQRFGLAKIAGHGSGGVDVDWNPQYTLISGFPTALAIADNDAVYLGGYTNLVKLSNTGTGAQDTAWSPAPDSTITALIADGTSLYVSGFFSTIGGQPIHGLAKLPLDAPANAAAGWDPSLGFPARALSLDANGMLYVGGNYQLGPRGGLARVNIASGAPDVGWGPPGIPAPLGGISDFAFDVAGDLIIAMRTYVDAPAQTLQKVSTNDAGEIDPAWNPAPNGNVYALTKDPAGRLFVGGDFTTIGGRARLGFAKFADPDVIFSDTFDGP